MLNRVVFIGRLTRDPELRYVGDGTPVATFAIAVERPFKNAQGQKETDFIRCKAWKKLAETVAQNLQKGRLVAVDGRLEVRNYEAQDGTKRTVSEVVADSVQFLDWPKDSQPGPKELTRDEVEDIFGPVPDNLPFDE